MASSDFARAYAEQPLFVVDCTYDDEGGNGGEGNGSEGGGEGGVGEE